MGVINKMIKIAILGFGTVGSGVYELIKNNKDIVAKNAGIEIETKYILDIRDFSNHEDAHLFVKDYDVILNDAEVSVVVETIGGLEPAFTFTKKALEKGKHVVTSNKELVATKGNECSKTVRPLKRRSSVPSKMDMQRETLLPMLMDTIHAKRYVFFHLSYRVRV